MYTANYRTGYTIALLLIKSPLNFSFVMIVGSLYPFSSSVSACLLSQSSLFNSLYFCFPDRSLDAYHFSFLPGFCYLLPLHPFCFNPEKSFLIYWVLDWVCILGSYLQPDPDKFGLLLVYTGSHVLLFFFIRFAL